MEPTRSRTARDHAAAQARSRPSTQFAEQYPSYPQQAQQLRRPPQQAPQQAPHHQQSGPQPLFTDLLERPAPPQPRPQRMRAPEPVPARPPQSAGVKALRRLLGLLTFAVLTGLSLPLHVLAVFFVYVQVESPADVASAGPLLGGMFLAVIVVLIVIGLLTQLIGGFPGRWRARVTFSFLSAVIALGIAYGAALTQF